MIVIIYSVSVNTVEGGNLERMGGIGTFALGILASLIASILWVIILNIMSKRFRGLLYGIIDVILNTDLKYIYNNSDIADNDIVREMQESSKIYIYTGRGQFLQGQEYANVFDKDSTDVKVILPVPDPNNKWLKQRAHEMNAINKGFTNNTLATDIQSIATFLKPQVDDNKIQLHYSDSQHIGKIIILDNCAFFVPYQKDKFGKATKVYEYKIGAYMYNWLQRYFDALWDEDVKWPSL